MEESHQKGSSEGCGEKSKTADTFSIPNRVSGRDFEGIDVLRVPNGIIKIAIGAKDKHIVIDDGCIKELCTKLVEGADTAEKAVHCPQLSRIHDVLFRGSKEILQLHRAKREVIPLLCGPFHIKRQFICYSPCDVGCQRFVSSNQFLIHHFRMCAIRHTERKKVLQRPESVKDLVANLQRHHRQK